MSLQKKADDAYLNAMYATYKSTFNHVGVYPVFPDNDPSERQNLLFVMTDNEAAAKRLRSALKGQDLHPQVGLVMTDDFSPVEQLIHR